MVELRSERPRIVELLQHDSYTPEELAELLGMSAYRIRHSVREGELPAFIVGHHILSIRRADALEWLQSHIR